MTKKEAFIEADHFVVVIPDILTTYERKILTYFYAPILGPKALALYTTFYSIVMPGETESEMMSHSALFNLMQIKKADKFLEERSLLEALGLLDTYYYETKPGEPNRYVYLVKRVLEPYAFVNDPFLAQILKTTIGDEAFEQVVANFLVRNFDISRYKNISKTFDEVFTITDEGNMIDFSSWWVDGRNKGLKIKDAKQNFLNVKIQMASLDKWTIEVMEDPRLQTECTRYGFFFGLNPEEIVQALEMATTSDKKIDYDRLSETVKVVYTNKNRPVTVKKIPTTPSKPVDKTINQLETLSPADVFKNKTGTELLPSEIQILVELQKATGVSIGIINTLMIYVTEQKGGEFPSYNFFLKVLNTWIRAGVKTTEDAIKYINRAPNERKTTRKEKAVPEWFDKHLEEEKKRDEEKRKAMESEDNLRTLEELEAFFQPTKKKSKKQ